MNPWDQLIDGVQLPFHPDLRMPELHEVRFDVPSPDPVPIERANDEANRQPHQSSESNPR